MIFHGSKYREGRLGIDRGGHCVSIFLKEPKRPEIEIPAFQITSVEVVTSENKNAIANAAFATLLAGPEAGLLSAVTAGFRKTHLVVISTAVEESLVAEISQKELKHLSLVVTMNVTAARNAASDAGSADPAAAPYEFLSKRIPSGDENDPTICYLRHLEGIAVVELDDDAIDDIKEFRRELRLGKREVALAHVRFLADALQRSIDRGAVSDRDVLRLRAVKKNLVALGWMPGD